MRNTSNLGSPAVSTASARRPGLSREAVGPPRRSYGMMGLGNGWIIEKPAGYWGQGVKQANGERPRVREGMLSFSPSAGPGPWAFSVTLDTHPQLKGTDDLHRR